MALAMIPHASLLTAWTSSESPFWQKYGYAGAAVAVLVTILVTHVGLYIRAQAQRRKTLPPGPRGWPILGNLPAIAASDVVPHRVLGKLSSKYGGLMYLQLGSVPCVVVSTAEAAKAMTFRANDECFLSRPKLLTFEIFSLNFKTMIFAPSGKYWRRLRRLSSNELFSSKRLASYQDGREAEFRNMIKGILEDSKSGQPMVLRQWLYEITANIMTQMLVNKRLFGIGADSQDVQGLKAEFEQFMTKWKMSLTANIASNYFPCLRFFTERVQGWRSTIEAYRDSAMRLGEKLLDVEKHRQRAAEKGNEVGYVPDFVDVISAAPLDEGKLLQDKNLLTMIVLEFFAAGTGTSATSVEWAMAELMLHPHVMKRAQEELDAAVGMDRLVQEDDIANLPFLQAVVKETFRLHPPAPLGLPRESTVGAEVLGFHIPAKTRVTLNIFAIHRDPAVYEYPDEFNPDRFLDRHVDANHLSGFSSFELIPFGVGRRMCPGYNLGNTMTSVILANLIHSYDWSLPKGESTVDTSEGRSGAFAIGMKNPLRLIPKLRNESLAY